MARKTAPIAPVAIRPAAGPTIAKSIVPTTAPAPMPASGQAPTAQSTIESKPAPIAITQEAIAQAAYFRWQRCGGDPQTNWDAAERELREEFARSAPKA